MIFTITKGKVMTIKVKTLDELIAAASSNADIEVVGDIDCGGIRLYFLGKITVPAGSRLLNLESCSISETITSLIKDVDELRHRLYVMEHNQGR